MAQNQMQMAALQPARKDVALAIIAAVCEARNITPAENDLRGLPGAFRRLGGEFWLVEAGGAGIGTIGICPLKEASGEWHIRFMCLQPAWRGMGIGRMMAERAIDFARQKRADRIVVGCPVNDPAMQPLFKSLGFQVVDAVQDESAPGMTTMRKVFA